MNFGVKSMLERYVQIRKHLPSLKIFEIDVLPLSRRQSADVDRLMKNMKAFDTIIMSIREKTVKLGKVVIFFHIAIAPFPDLQNRLSVDSGIVETKCFRDGCIENAALSTFPPH